MATYRNPGDSILCVSDSSYQPPPPYTALQTLHHRPMPPKPLIIEDIKDERRRHRSGAKKSSKDDRYDSRHKSHKIHRSPDYSRSNVSVATPPPSRTDLHLRQPVIPERAPVLAVPSHSPPVRTNDPLPAETVREGSLFYDDICTAIDRAASTLDLSTNLSRSRGIGSTNTYAYYQDAPRTSHQNNTSLQLDEIVPDATARENVSSKVYNYGNSRLPRDLMPFRAYMETYRLLSIAARYSLSAYSPPSHSSPSGSETESHIPASFLTGTKAMVLKSIPVDNQNTLIFAIRGSSSFADWAVNFRPAPASPSGFLDDAENYCHSGFLSVARSMVRPVAARLRQLLEQDPSRCNSSLLITGHSAGGAVAALLYAHMLSQSVESELTILTNVFRRVHCVTFGAPPVSLLPLTKPNFERYRKWCFFGVINQGDPVVRASKEYVASLARLWLASVPAPRPAESDYPRKSGKMEKGKKDDEKGKKKCAKGLLKVVKSMADLRASGQAEPPRPLVKPVWNVPPAQLSCAGRLVLLREKPGSVGTGDHMVEACAVTDEMLRGVIFGEAAMHSMSLYARRTEMLAFRAVTGREG
ncbi:Alpha/Beta hydrolase protein [Elsinoe ampelina]|uniref:Alpha/Beta hydrolase protein n=1 Tax=Elsinoe ampelina TaxID=302913 RepID=A0A6A6GHC9_9PEZI|nr:Alpha/Beta hydrolase protein [Elsinoe ampelina]